MEKLTTAEQYRKFVSLPAIQSAKYFFDYLLDNEYSKLGGYISDISTGKTPPKSNESYFNSSDICWYKPSDIGGEIYLIKSDNYISNIAISDKKATLFKKGTVLVTCIGDIGRIGILKKDSSANQQITGILTNGELLSEFAFLYLASHREIFTDSDVLTTTLPIINQKKITLPTY